MSYIKRAHRWVWETDPHNVDTKLSLVIETDYILQSGVLEVKSNKFPHTSVMTLFGCTRNILCTKKPYLTSL